MTEEKPNEINKETFLRTLASQAGFTMSDTKIFWREIEKIFASCLANGYILNITGFGKLYAKNVNQKNNRFWNISESKYSLRKPGKRLVFKVSSRLKRIVKQYGELEKLENAEEDDEKNGTNKTNFE